MAEPSGDIDENGCAEIWPVLYELAIQTASSMIDSDFTGPRPGGVGQESAGVVRMVTGQESQTISVEGKTDDEILEIIQHHFIPGHKNIIYETKKPIQEIDAINLDLAQQVPPQPKVVAGHAYYVEAVAANAVLLDNPWGEDPIIPKDRDLNLTKDWLSETARSLTILAPCGN
jgi:hypothetical protein